MGRLDGKRILITQSSSFMGPALRAAFEGENADVLTDDRDLTILSAADDLIGASGRIDALVVNLAAELPRSLASETSDEAWASMFEIMVHPMGRLVRAVLPQMIARRSGKVLVMTSGSALRGNPRWSAYAAARGAQVSYVRSVGMEVAPHNVQVNAIAQSFVENPVYFPPGWLETSEAKQRMPQVPAARLAKPSEDGYLATFLVSAESDFFVGQIIPFTGGWVS
jgi:NAD(P)-dependent dehydrogenase (short-subunit alcohol dehydrogenase family)